MPSIFSHAIFATVVGRALTRAQVPVRFWVLTALCSMLPDADVAGFAFGIRYGSLFGHRGITHSILFALLVGVAIGIFAFRSSRVGLSTTALIIYFTLVTLSHPLLDMMTDGGSGVALFAPFSAERYFLPWRPIEVSPIGMRFFSQRGLEVIESEIVWVWLPALVLLLAAWLYRKLQRSLRRG
ncbi:MAG: metal-dependent hydrolase [Pyrinomonadaceae bacterium]|nr:metal-dependent hydrolase [Pyrinomonadaceae bacterium]